MTGAVDVAIIGGGPAGAAAARALARAGVSTLVIERLAEPCDRPGESLAPNATPLLQRLGLFDAFLATAPLPCFGNRSCWGESGEPATYDFIRHPYGHGWHIDRRAFDRMLLGEVRASGADVAAGVSLTGVRRDGTAWLLGLSTGQERRARLAIDASGRAAAFARRLGARRRHLDRLVAVTAVLTSHPPHAGACEDSTTLVEAAPEGWWYSAALPGGRLALAFMTDPDLLARLGLSRWAHLRAHLASAPQTLARVDAGRFKPVAAPRLAAAGSSILGQTAGEGWLACGDAAAAYDPLSSHGIGAGLSMGARAAATAAAWLAGDGTAVSDYARRVQESFARYLALQRAYYAMETRWPGATFWARRGAATAPPPAFDPATVHG
jgi:flavin-dependent dehydrogenase